MYDSRLQYRDTIKLNDLVLSIYQKVFKYADDGSMSNEEFKKLEYKNTMSHYLFLNQSDTYKSDSEYDFRLIVDTWQLNRITELLDKHKDTLCYDELIEWFKSICDEVHSLYATTIGYFGYKLAYHGEFTTKLSSIYKVSNNNDPFEEGDKVNE